MKFEKDGEYYYFEIENKEELEKLKEDIIKKLKEKQKRKLT
jgi:hypothetical protein